MRFPHSWADRDPNMTAGTRNCFCPRECRYNHDWVIVSIYVIIFQGETVRSRAAVIRVTDNEVDYFLTNLALRVIISFGYAAKAPTIRGPFEEDMMSNELLTCGSICWWYGYGLEAGGGRSFLSFFLSLVLKTQPNRISAKSSLVFWRYCAAQRICQQQLVVEMWRACASVSVCVFY